jgi:intraflagellar transport protein 81
MKEQNEQLKIAEKKLIEVRKSLKQVQSANATSNADLLWQRMEEETKMNRFIATENLPKAINDKQKNIDNITRILTETSTSESDLQVSEMEIRDLNEAIAKLAEKKLTKNRNAGNDKLALFRQQANIIALKKEGTAEKIHSLVEKLNQLNEELEKKEGAKGESETKILKGEEFKKYVSELRTKSSVYKRKKVELSELTTELGVLQRTDEILKNHIKDFQDSIYKIEKENGIVGYHDTQETLEKVSEKKNEMDETKGKTLNEISSLVDKIVQTINDKKAVLTTVIQEVRALRTKAQDLETDYIEKKKVYDTTIASLESDSCALEQEVRGYRQDIINDQSRYHYLNAMLNISEISLDRVLQETKAYIGGDEKFEEIQKIRGFKSYRELYNKKLNEQENLGEMLRNTQKEVKACHEADMKQLEMFKNIKKLLDLKIETNRKLLLGEKNNEEFEGQMVQDRLIL